MQTKTRIQEAADAVVRKAKAGTPYPIAITEVSAAGVNRTRLTEELARRRAARKKAQAVAK
jgi:Trm5-related predicted tRNA methylase